MATRCRHSFTGMSFRSTLSDAVNSDSELSPRMRVDSVYKQNPMRILTSPKLTCPLAQSGSGASTYRATSKQQQLPLKMRIKLHKGDWSGVIAEGNTPAPAAAPFAKPHRRLEINRPLPM